MSCYKVGDLIRYASKLGLINGSVTSIVKNTLVFRALGNRGVSDNEVWNVSVKDPRLTPSM